MTKNLLSRLDEKNLKEIFENDTLTFSERVKILGLNPVHDFMHSDLSGVDFTAADLRGYNFYGANLSNSLGFGFKHDDTTLFDGADLDNSPFKFKQQFNQKLTNPTFITRFENINSGDTLSRASFVSETASSSSSSEDSIIIARMIIHESNSSFIQNAGIYSLVKLFEKEEEFSSFFKSLLAEKFHVEAIVRASIDIISSLHRESKFSSDLLFELLNDPRPSIAVSALRSISRLTNAATKHHAKIMDIISGQSWNKIITQIQRSAIFGRHLVYINKHDKNIELKEVQLGFRKKLNSFDLENLHVVRDEFLLTKRILSEDSKLNNLVNPNDYFRKKRLTQYFEDIYMKTNIKFPLTEGALQKYKLSDTYKRNSREQNLNSLAVPNMFNHLMRTRGLR